MTSKRSKLEDQVASWIEPLGAAYEDTKVDYVVQKTYVPDFALEDGMVLVEVKGYFRPGDTQKYAAIATQIMDTDSKWYVFILQNPNKPVRKGAKMTMGEWCDKHSIIWFDATDSEGFEEWLNGSDD